MDGSALVPAADGDAPLAPLVRHIRAFAALTLVGFAHPADVDGAALESALRDADNAAKIARFASDAKTPALVVRREDAHRDGDDDTAVHTAFSVSTEVKYEAGKGACVAFIKRGAVIETDKPIAPQVRYIDLGEGSPYETLHAYLHNAVAPFFTSFLGVHGKDGDSDASGGASGVKKKIAELEVSLLHLQQNTDIPEVILAIHPRLASEIDRAHHDGRRVKTEDFADVANEASFLNALQTYVGRWIKEIQKVTKLERDPSTGTAMQEMSFWLNLERALLRVSDELKSDGIQTTLALLKNAKRFHATTGFDSDTGLAKALHVVNNYNQLMRDFPLSSLLSATETERIAAAVGDMFMHLRKLRSTTSYPLERATAFVEAISRDVALQVARVLRTRRLFHMPYEEFERTMSGVAEVFTAWEGQLVAFKDMCRDIFQKRIDQKKVQIRIDQPEHEALVERLRDLRAFRKQYEQLRAVVARVLRPGDSRREAGAAEFGSDAAASAVDDISRAYDDVASVDPLDVSRDGSEAWEAALARFDERVGRVETHITSHLRDQLGTAKNANEMFRIFSRYNALFVRPRIRGAIQEYQAKLIGRVKEDIQGLQEKFKAQYAQSPGCRMATARDLPPVTGAIIWARQLDRQLATLMRRVEDVLGKGWEAHVEGQRLKEDGDNFRRKLDVQGLFKEWVEDTESRRLQPGGVLFSILAVRFRGAAAVSGAPQTALRLAVNFDQQLVTLFKEVRNLQYLGFRPPNSVVTAATAARDIYPHAVSLIETVRGYGLVCDTLTDNEWLSPLVAAYVKDAHLLISEGVGQHWESMRLESFVRRLSESVSVLRDRTEEMVAIAGRITSATDGLSSCALIAEAIGRHLAAIQDAVDELNLKMYSNLGAWVARLDKRIEELLGARILEALSQWTASFLGLASDDDGRPDGDAESGVPSPAVGLAQVAFPSLVHEIRVRNQVMFLDPPLEQSRASLHAHLHSVLARICGHMRLRAARFSVAGGAGGSGGSGLTPSSSSALSSGHDHTDDYRALLASLPDDGALLSRAYEAIEDRLRRATAYVSVWLRYQSLWDMEPGAVYGRLGDDLATWQRLLNEIRTARATFDNSETKRSFGPIVVDYGQVQAKVNLKYDAWHKDVLGKFGAKLGAAIQELFAEVAQSRTTLESHSIEGDSTSDAVTFVTFVQDLKRKTRAWEGRVRTYRDGQRLLERQRFQFPADWTHIDQLDSEFGAFSDILGRKDTSIQERIASLQARVVAEDRAIDAKSLEMCEEWDVSKPVRGDLRPDMALSTLSSLESKFVRVRDDWAKMARAKEALGLETPSANRVEGCLAELQDLRGVWAEMAKVSGALDELRERPWTSVVPRKVRQALDDLSAQLKALPSRMRQYAAYDNARQKLKDLLKANSLVADLKSEAIKDRHWKALTKRLGVRWGVSELSLGMLYDVDLVRNEKVVREFVTIAQGEMALEEYLRSVRETWNAYELELVNYQNKCRLVRGWDDLFGKIKEHLGGVTQMKLSPYYKVFEEDASGWEERLNRVNALFDVWIDVQRRWVYLEGIFAGSADIKHLLPAETARFASVGAEFTALLRKVAKSPLVLEVLAIPNVQRSLERLADLLSKIQKALGEYLEKEREQFPRFYFVGDEDLLEIIGNSRDLGKIQKHLRKMFAGINTVVLDDASETILGMCSREGEVVTFVTPVSVKNNPRINEWLSLLEREMRHTLASLLVDAVGTLPAQFGTVVPARADAGALVEWIDRYPAQLVVLALQVAWSQAVEAVLAKGGSTAGVSAVVASLERTLGGLADTVLVEQPQVRRRKLEHLITELVHERDITRGLASAAEATGPQSFTWLQHMRFYFDASRPDVLERLSIRMADASFHYGFEYLGIADRLVQTPLTDQCYLTLTQALHERLGGSPFGPAGTGKTETVKALGCQLGRFVLVFNCDETFDFQAMGRIFVGLCQVGAWGCFDEFNRLEERMLSAVSQQIQTIQTALRDNAGKPDAAISIELIGKPVRVNAAMGIFITMNPGYAGRSNLPDNLKRLFRNIAMTSPDRQMIAQVMLYSQGFRSAETLAGKIVPLFKLCDEQLSSQPHYDFGLRALKSVLVSAGHIKRVGLVGKVSGVAGGEQQPESVASETRVEQEVLMRSVCETMVPKLVAEDIPLLHSLLADVFPGVHHAPVDMQKLREVAQSVCAESFLVFSEEWAEKVLQLHQIQLLHHGVMMVGPSGTGKTSAWRVLLKALERVEGIDGIAHLMDPKAISKDELYGTLDPTTREWTDGIFTHTLRKIIDNVRGEAGQRHWIIFDGDVDPEWVENLNSVLDDNRLLTLPNGERLGIPPNVRIMFEVQDLRYATLATVSRCGMVWFSAQTVTDDMVFAQYLARLRAVPLDGSPAGAESTALTVQRDCADILAPLFAADALIPKAIEYAERLERIMPSTRLRMAGSLFSMLNADVRFVLEYNALHPDFPMEAERVERVIQKRAVLSVLWCLAGDASLKGREQLGDFLRSLTSIPMPPTNAPVIDYDVSVAGEWVAWKVPQTEVDTHRIAAADVVVPTVDTVRHEHLLKAWLAEHRPLVLCGPPGSGKTMTLFSALRAMPELDVVGVNFSSATTPELILRTFEHHCEYRRTPSGTVLAPTQPSKWLVLFCDEINLPDQDKYGTQRVISFIRQLVEHGGFWRAKPDHSWVSLERIQFVGACNPPTDPGRKPLSARFLRHVPVLLVDYPGQVSLGQIYGTFNRALLRLVPSLRPLTTPLTDAMVELYLASQQRFTADVQPHYVYSPRELTRWVRGLHEAIKPLESLTADGLVRLWAHEALRLFQDRLVAEDERRWTDEKIDEVAAKHFVGVDLRSALARPILFSNWLSKEYISVDRERLREYVRARLKVFHEEELDVQLVLFNEVLDHVLRIDRVFRQTQGHLLLIGASGAGKTTLSRFVAWINGLSVFQIRAHAKYTSADFEDDLRAVLLRAGCGGERICFVMDESNILDSGFLERMNTLLANGEVPGLFEGDEFAALMTQCREGAQRQSLMLDSQDELYAWFTQQVMRNLHVVFTMNPTTDGLKDRAATSPALFNRCVLDWFGDWSEHALYQVGKEFTGRLDLDAGSYVPPQPFPASLAEVPAHPSQREALASAFVFVHKSVHEAAKRLSRRDGRTTHVTPRHYLDFIDHYVSLFGEKTRDLEEQQLHLNVGLRKITDTVGQVEEMQSSLAAKSAELERKNTQANSKLQQMVHDQQEAERRRQASLEIQSALAVQTRAVSEKRAVVLEDLSKVEPAVEEAQRSVKSIKKQHLVEVRAMANPPKMVKMALEAICVLLGEDSIDWKAIRSVIVRDDFISNIVSFKTDDVKDSQRERLIREYLSNPEFTVENVNKASKACGPLCQWAVAQVQFADMLKKVAPLREELASLERSAEETRLRDVELNRMVAELEASIGRYKEEYAVLISEVQAIKSEMTSVRAKVDRSIALLGSLGDERSRWLSESESFRAQMSTIVGDVLLSAAFMAYGGYFDQQYRFGLVGRWSTHLHRCSLSYRGDLSLSEYLSTPDDRLSWQSHSLPADDLCTENAIMLRRHKRYPLVIDPSGQALKFILSVYGDRRIARTSFLDDSFRKNLESALRFGTPLIVQDVEAYDPILNPVLNRELRRAGGRVLIRIGDQDIDFSPSFSLFLFTRDQTAEFPPDLCSRVTFVNFTVTPASLQTQCLNQVLRTERPEIDAKRSDLLKLQGEFRLRLRHLEQELLRALNEARGKILDDDAVIATLETLKKEASEVSRKVADTDLIMIEIEQASAEYRPLATACSALYFMMESLGQAHFLYQYALQSFLDMYSSVLSAPRTAAHGSTPQSRLATIAEDVFRVVYTRLSRGMLQADHPLLAFLIAGIRIRGSADDPSEDELTHLMRGREANGAQAAGGAVPSPLTVDCAGQLRALQGLASFGSGLSQHVTAHNAEWAEFLKSPQAEMCVPQCWNGAKIGVSDSRSIFRELLVVQAFRPDRLVAAVWKYATSVFGSNFFRDAGSVLDLGRVAATEVHAHTPILMCSVAGYDAGNRVIELAASASARLSSVAIGSAEGFVQADRAVAAAVKSGEWVLLRNVHLAPQWLVSLEKRLHALGAPNPQFRLFMTAEIIPALPPSMLRMSRVLVVEPPPGVRANLLRSYAQAPSAIVSRGPAERARVHFMLAWLHAVLQERLRYVPLGFTKRYEFGESDLRSAMAMVDAWVEAAARGRANLPPDQIPWDAIATLIQQSIYGGRIDNPFDARVLRSFLNRFFTAKVFEADFELVRGRESICAPDGVRSEDFVRWADGLSESQTPEWLGLPANAETVMLETAGNALVAKILKMQTMADEDELAPVADAVQVDLDGKPSWMRQLHATAVAWLGAIPESVPLLQRSPTNIKDPLFRFFEREGVVGATLLARVRGDLSHILNVSNGRLKQTNDIRRLMSDLVKGNIPPEWRRYPIPNGLTVGAWMVDFAARLGQLQAVAAAPSPSVVPVWVGGLFFPEAFVTATRQAVAQSTGHSLEELALELHIGDGGDGAFSVTGLDLEGAAWNEGRLDTSATGAMRLAGAAIAWRKCGDSSNGRDNEAGRVTVPIYLNSTRANLLFTVDLPMKPALDADAFYQCGVAITCSSLRGGV